MTHSSDLQKLKIPVSEYVEHGSSVHCGGVGDGADTLGKLDIVCLTGCLYARQAVAACIQTSTVKIKAAPAVTRAQGLRHPSECANGSYFGVSSSLSFNL